MAGPLARQCRSEPMLRQGNAIVSETESAGKAARRIRAGSGSFRFLSRRCLVTASQRLQHHSSVATGRRRSPSVGHYSDVSQLVVPEDSLRDTQPDAVRNVSASA